MDKPFSAAERVRRSRWAGQVEVSADRLHQLLLSAPIPMPREPHINHDLIAGLIELTGYRLDAHPEEDAFDVVFTASGKNQRDWMREIAQQCHFDRDLSIKKYSKLDEDGTIPRKRRSMSSDDYALALWSDGISKGWLSLPSTTQHSEASHHTAGQNPNVGRRSKDFEIKKSLRSMGKSCFVKYYDDFANPSLSTEDLVEILVSEEGYTEAASRTRTSNARRIINSGKTKQALNLIISSGRLDEEVRTRAEQILSIIS